ncbi:hypothetical protein EVAR_60643_1 [Eumeta japonica]|uniref:Uncharacterized protein n=1 Tax=Eumeta variegata TaxID=151549 RepID=A0A4C1ZQ10_EUMVA|nr:hypothetical protein EVAR_60643_1 [Eumeta japonica]
MDTRSKIVISELAVSSAWVITALQRALATRTQTDDPPAFFSSKASRQSNRAVRCGEREARYVPTTGTMFRSWALSDHVTGDD